MESRMRPGEYIFACAAAFLAGVFEAAYLEVPLPILLALAVPAGAGIFIADSIKRYRFIILGILGLTLLGAAYYPARAGNSFDATTDWNYFPQSSSVVRDNLNEFLSGREAELLRAILTGTTRGMDKGLKQEMESSGTAYIVGMYGYKLHLLIEAVFEICRRFAARAVAFAIAFAAMASFVICAGAPVSAVRAGIMVGFALAAKASGRLVRPLNMTLIAAAAMTAWDPSLVKSSGFILSFASIVGIYSLGPKIQKLFGRTSASPSPILSWESHATMAIAVNTCILPIVTATYGGFPLISFISNALVSVLLGGLLFGGTLLALIGAHFHAAGIILSAFLTPLLWFELQIVKICSKLPMNAPAVFGAFWGALCYYFFLAIIAFKPIRQTE